MKQMESQSRLDGADSDATRSLRRIIVTAGPILVGLILALAAV